MIDWCGWGATGDTAEYAEEPRAPTPEQWCESFVRCTDPNM
jgi:hypothetical protein